MIVGTRTLKVSDSKFLVATYRWFNARVEDGRVVNEPTKFIFAVDSRRFELSTTPLPTRPRERIDCQFDRRNIDLNSTGRIEMPMKWGLGVLLLFQSMRDAPIGADRPAVTLRIPQGWVSTKFEANDLTQLPMIMGIRTIAITRGLGSLEIDNQERRVSRSHLMIATGTDLALEPTTSDGMRLIGQVDALSVDNVRALNTRWELLAVGLQALLLTTVSTLMVFLGRALWQHFPSRKGTWTSWRQ
jgi:hypothetical protein